MDNSILKLKEWNFSRESETLLQTILKQIKDETKPQNNFFDRYKDKIKKTVNQTEDINTSSDSASVILITSDEEEIENINISTKKELHEDVTQENIEEKIQHTFKAFSELLESNERIRNDDLIFLNDLTENELKNLFQLLYTSLSAEGIYNIVHSVCISDVVKQKLIIHLIIESLLLPKFLGEDVLINSEKSVSEILKLYPEIVSENLLLPILLNKKGERIFPIISLLETEEKKNLLRKYVSKIPNLEPEHIKTLSHLFSPLLEDDIKNQIINLMKNGAADFKSDITFGKLLLNIVNSLKETDTDQLIVLEYLAEQNESTFQNTIRKKVSKLNI